MARKQSKKVTKKTTERRGRGKHLSPQLHKSFLAWLRVTGSVVLAAKKVQVDRATFYERRSADEAFRKLWDQARLEAYDLLEEEAVRRACYGVLRPVFQGGKKVGVDPPLRRPSGG